MKTNYSNHSAINYTARIIALGLLAFLLLCTLARSHAQAADTTVGVYKLISVDGKNVPCTINHDGRAMNVQTGTFMISTNGQITSVMNISAGDKKRSIETHATYTEKNSELTMKWQNAGTTKGRVAGNTFTMTNEGMVYVYQK